jgi:phosphoglycolate phosphatase-like HAD superfamily hydrolase
VKDQKKAIVFDFDCTLTSVHLYFLRNSKEDFVKTPEWLDLCDENSIDLISKILDDKTPMVDLDDEKKEKLVNVIFGGEERLRMLRDFLELLKKNEFDIYISSNNSHQQIVEVLNLFNLTEFFVDINANGNNPLGGDKSDFMTHLKNKLGYNVIYYVDDDPCYFRNILDDKTFLEITYKYFGGYVNNKNIFDEEICPREDIDHYASNIGLKKDANGLSEEMVKIIKNEIGLDF